MEKDLKSLIIIFKAYHSLKNNVKHSLLDTDINMNEFTAMEALYVKGELTTQELIDTVLIPNSSMTYVLEILNHKKYIRKRKKEEDKRVQIISLTNFGETVFEEIYARHFKYMRSIFDVLSKDQELQLQKVMKRLGKEAEGKIK